MIPARIVILGAGFAALTAVRELRRRSPDARITLIAPKAEFVYLPSLIWVPTGIRQGKDLILPLGRFIKDHAVEFVSGRVTGLEDGGRTVVTDQGKVANDALIIATGGRFIKKLPGIEHALTLCEGLASAEAIRDRLQKMTSGRIAMGFGGNPNEPSAMRGGPMFELLFGIDTWLRRQGRRDSVELTFFNAAAEPGKRLGEKAVSGLLAEMARRRIDTHLGHKPLGFSEKGVDTEGGHVNADLILFMP
ncbi:MAG: FAD-dependent oxidoreductase, partial [Rhodocyclales bacterium]|nr:FAD-dependent oxidoreductase [Rhodocyclales bacterium]